MKQIYGEIYNIQDDRGKLIKGWFIVIDNNNQEYLVQRNYSGISNWYRNVYKSDISFKKNLRKKAEKKRNIWVLFLIIGLIISKIFSKLISFDIFFGVPNRTGNIFVGLSNIAIVIIPLILSCVLLSISRKSKLKAILKNKNGKLYYIGKIKAKSYLQELNNGRDFW